MLLVGLRGAAESSILHYVVLGPTGREVNGAPMWAWVDARQGRTDAVYLRRSNSNTWFVTDNDDADSGKAFATWSSPSGSLPPSGESQWRCCRSARGAATDAPAWAEAPFTLLLGEDAEAVRPHSGCRLWPVEKDPLKSALQISMACLC